MSVENRGNAHVQVRKFAVTASGGGERGSSKETATYVLQNARKVWVIHNEQLAASAKLLIVGQTDYGDLREVLAPSNP